MKRIALSTLPDVAIAHHPEVMKRVLLAAGDVPHLAQLARARLAPGQVAAGHAHAGMWEIFLVEDGEGVMRVDGVSHALAPGRAWSSSPVRCTRWRRRGGACWCCSTSESCNDRLRVRSRRRLPASVDGRSRIG